MSKKYEVEIVKTGYLPNVWYGKCDNCNSILRLTSDGKPEKNYKVIEDVHCSYCSVYVTFYRVDTGVGKSIREEVIK